MTNMKTDLSWNSGLSVNQYDIDSIGEYVEGKGKKRLTKIPETLKTWIRRGECGQQTL